MIGKNRKWKLVKWRLAIEAIVILGSMGGALLTKNTQPWVTFMIGGFVDLTASYATYFASNVVQKNIISKNYIKDLHETEPEA